MKRVLITITLALFTLPIVNAQEIKLNGTVSAENNQIKKVADPTDAQDAATKAYTDALIAALQLTSASGTVTDQDGNSYTYLTYGDQVWTVKNAEMETYRDGTEIPQVNYEDWTDLTTGAWCYYENNSSKGKLYNWYAVMGIHNPESDERLQFAPEGWHVPSDDEWTELEDYLIFAGYNFDGTSEGIAKAMASTTGWVASPTLGTPGKDPGLNNSSGFNAFPLCLLYTSPSPRDVEESRMPSSA